MALDPRLPRQPPLLGQSLHARTWALLALLGSSAVLVLALVVLAVRTAARQRAVAAKVLRDHATEAAWRYATGYSNAVERVLMPALLPTVGVALSRGSPLPGLGGLQRSAVNTLRCRRPAEDSVRFFFRLDLRSGRVLVSQPAVRGIGAGLAKTVRSALALAPPDGLVLKGFRAPGGQRRLLAFGALRDAAGIPVAAYGFLTCPSGLDRLFPVVMAWVPLLPPSLTGPVPNDSVLSVTALHTATGDTLYVSPVRYPDSYSAQLASVGVLGITFRVALRPELAPRLIIGGVTGSRLPLLFSLLALTAGIMAMALLQLRREQLMARARSDFVAGVSHELRTPLAQILLFADSLRLGRARSGDQRALALDIIAQEARRLIHLVENVLYLSRPNRRAAPLIAARHCLAPMVRDVVSGYAPLASGRDVAFRILVDETLGVAADADAFRQILLNLLDNAVKFGPPGQRVTVRAELRGERVRIGVEDEGRGVAERHREAMWRPFVRVDGDANQAPGSGIGLAIVRDLVERHGGEVWYETTLSGGARFVFELSAGVGAEAP